MKYLFFIVFALLVFNTTLEAHEEKNYLASDLLEKMQPGDKAALLAVHFGTTHDDTRSRTIDVINDNLQKAFPGMEFREAWTSRIVIRRNKKRGIEKFTPTQVLEQLKKEGFTHILIQSTNIIEGIEMEALRKEADAFSGQFKDIRIGHPLLYTVDDYRQTVNILAKEKPLQGKAVVLVGHGTYTPSTSTYAMLDYMLKSEGYPHFFVGTIEGYPSFNDMLQQLKATEAKEVMLVPFMFVAGDHAKNDIAGEWKEALQKKGYTVTVSMKGLGEYQAIRKMFTDHALFIKQNKAVDIMDKKKKYASDKE